MAIDLEALAVQLAAADPAQRELIRQALGVEPTDIGASLDRMAAAHAAADERLAAVATGLAQLADRVDRLTATVDDLGKDMKELSRAQTATDAKLGDLVDVVKGMNDKLGRLDGESFERRCRERGHARFSRVARRLRYIDFDTLGELLDEGETGGLLTDREVESVMDSNAVFRGRLRPDGDLGHLVIEASVTVNHNDVRRARDRADLLARVVDTPVIAVVAGEFVPSPVAVAAQDADVWQVVPGKLVRPEDDLPEF
ncbi:hypothetical protein BH23ACT9_BH23ACT9_37720 [soil metagenome]